MDQKKIECYNAITYIKSFQLTDLFQIDHTLFGHCTFHHLIV